MYHRQTNDQVWRYSKTLIARLQYYISDHQKDSDEHIQPPTYAYCTQVKSSTNTIPFSLSLSRWPPSLSTVVLKTRIPSGAYRDVPLGALRLHLLARTGALKKDIEKSILMAQSRYKEDSDKNVGTLPPIEVDRLFYVNTPPCAVLASEADKVVTESYEKLKPRMSGPY